MWSIRLYPNGATKEYEGKFMVILVLCTFPLNVASIRVQWNLSIKELNFKRTKTTKYAIGKGALLMDPGSFKQFKQCNNMTINIDALILKEYDQNDKEITINTAGTAWNKYLENNERKDNDNNDNKQILRAQFESYQHEMADKLSIYDAKIDSLSSNINELIKSNQEKDQKIISLTDELNHEMTAKEAEIKSLQNAANNKMQQLEQNINDKTSLLSSNIDELIKSNQGKDEEIKSLRDELNNHHQQLSAEKVAIKSIKNTLSNNTEQIDKIQQETATLNDRLTQILEEEKKDNNYNNDNNNDILSEINKLKEEINKIKSNKIGSNVPLNKIK